MLLRLTAAGFGLALCAAASSAGAASLTLKDVAVRVIVVTEARADVKIEVLRTDSRLPLTITADGDDIRVEGVRRGDDWWAKLFPHNIASCHGWADGQRVLVPGVGDFRPDDLPTLFVHMPLDAHIHAGGAIIGSLPSAQSLELHAAGCGTWTVGKVAGRFQLDEAGDDQIRLGRAGSLDAHLAGAGGVQARGVSDGVALHLSGASDLKIDQVSGPIELHIAGHGDVNLGPGHSPQMKVEIAGQADVRYAGTADRLDVAIAGQGDVDVARVDGPVNKSIAGQGSVTIGGDRQSTSGLGIGHGG